MNGGFQRDSRWPRWTDGPGAGGSWKEGPEDFRVEELPHAPPSGAGEHDWYWIEKVGRTTPEVVRALAAAAGVSEAAVGFAGFKDREARTVQAFTVQLGRPVEALPPGMSILSTGKTSHKLRNGQLAGNRFTLRIRGGDLARAQARITRIEATGVPNYYGKQRVGGDAPSTGKALLCGRGPRLEFSALKFAVSAYQSLLFNEVLRARGARRLPGDLSLDDPPDIPTGPMFGPRMRWPVGEAAELERRILDGERLPAGAWERFPKLTQGTRRPLWMRVAPELEPAADGFWLRFSLPAGSYATGVLEEVL